MEGGEGRTGFLVLRRQVIVKGVMRAIRPIVEAVAQAQRLRRPRHIGLQRRQFRCIALAIGPPAIGVGGAVSGGEVGEIAGESALDRDVGWDGGHDLGPQRLARGVVGEEDGWLPYGGESVDGVRYGWVGVVCTLKGGVIDSCLARFRCSVLCKDRGRHGQGETEEGGSQHGSL